MRPELAAIYAEVDEVLQPFSCETTGECCHFSDREREPFPTAVEAEEVMRAWRAIGAPRNKLPVVGRCPMLSPTGTCRIYASRPFGCRTYFCDRMSGGRLPREAIADAARRLTSLSERLFPNQKPRWLTTTFT